MNNDTSIEPKIWRNFIPIWTAPFFLMLYGKLKFSSEILNSVAFCVVLGVFGYGFYLPVSLYIRNKMGYGIAAIGAIIIPFILWNLLVRINLWLS